MKKTILLFLLIFNARIFFCLPYLNGRENKNGNKVIKRADSLIKEKKYKSAFILLNEFDKKFEIPEVQIKKVEIAINYFIKSLGHEMFSFKDLKE